MQAHFEPVDLASVTAELASVFRSAIERAGLTFTVDCPPLDEPVYLDREMWEKVVLNLLSNALKFTFDGSITVRVRREDDATRSSAVTDTGIGSARRRDAPAVRTIPPHRDDPRAVHGGQRNRAGAGQGAGRPARRHHRRRQRGRARAPRSPSGCPSARPPADRRPCPRTGDRARVSGVIADPYVQEALRWLPADDEFAPPSTTQHHRRADRRAQIGRRQAGTRVGRRRQRRHARIPGAPAADRRLSRSAPSPTASRRSRPSAPKSPTSSSATS